MAKRPFQSRFMIPMVEMVEAGLQPAQPQFEAAQLTVSPEPSQAGNGIPSRPQVN